MSAAVDGATPTIWARFPKVADTAAAITAMSSGGGWGKTEETAFGMGGSMHAFSISGLLYVNDWQRLDKRHCANN